MPYIPPREVPGQKVSRLLIGYGYTPTSLARDLGCDRKTAKARLDQPENFTLGELFKVSAKKHIPMAELREAISK